MEKYYIIVICIVVLLIVIAVLIALRKLSRKKKDVVSDREAQYELNSYHQSQPEFRLERGITVSIRQGDITDEDVDVIVNAANGRLQHGGGVARAIAMKAGEEINVDGQRALSGRRGRELKVSEVLHTGGYNLKAKYVIHAVGPIRGKDNPFSYLLKRTFYHCLEYADVSLEARSIAIPLISSGVFGGNKDECADALLCAVKEFSQDDSFKTVNEIRLINIDAEATRAINTTFSIGLN
ncbi:uncharacterized protein TM_0508-like, partial [Anneissia japonica]|uniref:uncharacterized protein TM_0508-like n=1 Tax=Anneissia japonica TaxID=1529436 RepID=UPI00142554F0